MRTYDELFEEIEKIEALDLKDKFYSWEEDGVTRYNFVSVTVDRYNCMWTISINLVLDPEIEFYAPSLNDKTNLEETIKEFYKYIENL